MSISRSSSRTGALTVPAVRGPGSWGAPGVGWAPSRHVGDCESSSLSKAAEGALGREKGYAFGKGKVCMCVYLACVCVCVRACVHVCVCMSVSCSSSPHHSAPSDPFCRGRCEVCPKCWPCPAGLLHSGSETALLWMTSNPQCLASGGT